MNSNLERVISSFYEKYPQTHLSKNTIHVPNKGVLRYSDDGRYSKQRDFLLTSITVNREGQGDGTELMNHLINSCKDAGYKSIILNKVESEDFFKKFGFKEDDEDFLNYRLYFGL